MGATSIAKGSPVAPTNKSASPTPEEGPTHTANHLTPNGSRESSRTASSRRRRSSKSMFMPANSGTRPTPHPANAPHQCAVLRSSERHGTAPHPAPGDTHAALAPAPRSANGRWPAKLEQRLVCSLRRVFPNPAGAQAHRCTGGAPRYGSIAGGFDGAFSRHIQRPHPTEASGRSRSGGRSRPDTSGVVPIVCEASSQARHRMGQRAGR